MSHCIYLLIISIFLPLLSYSNSDKSKIVNVFKTNNQIVLDGKLDEVFWSESNIIDNFFQQFPNDSVLANKKTEVRIVYTDTHIYISAKMYDSVPERYIVNSLKRDFDGLRNESVTFTFDTFYDKKNARRVWRSRRYF